MDTTETYVKMNKGVPFTLELVFDKSQTLPRDEGIYLDTLGNFYAIRFDTNHVIPLPRQDQLQAMIGEFDKCLHMIYWWTTGGYNSWGYENDSFTSMEQLWLALVMHEKYGKVWSIEKEDWVSSR